MKQQYDAVVVGAGPAGLLAAKALALNGFDIAVLDRRKDLRTVSRSCGQSLLPPNEYFFGDLFHYNAIDRRFCFTVSGCTIPYTGPVKNIQVWHMFSPGMHRMQFGNVQPGAVPIALSYDKDIMLSCMLDDLGSSHVDVLPGVECTGLQPTPAGIMVQTDAGAAACSYVIAADGANSRIVQMLGYNNNRRHIADLYAVSFFIEGFNSPLGDAIITTVAFLAGKPVYLFLLPRPESTAWNVIVLSLESSVDLKAAYTALCSDKRYASWFKGSRIVREFAAVEHVYSPVIRPCRNNVIIAGDAGACQELECLGSMITGWKSGCAVATALKERQLGIAPQALAQYDDWWLNTYIKRCDYQDYLSVFGLAYVFTSEEIIDYIFSLMGDTPFPPTFNPYTSVGLLGARLQGLMPRIMAERSDILQVLAGNMVKFPSDILAQTLAP